MITLSALSFFSSCEDAGYESKAPPGKVNDRIGNHAYDRCDEMENHDAVMVDTIVVQTTEELIKEISSHKVIKLEGQEYRLKSTLNIEGVKNLKILGMTLPHLMLDEQNGTVIQLLNAQNIYFDNLIIGHSKSQGHTGKQGIVRIEHCSNVEVQNCQIWGHGTFGLITNDVCRLAFNNSAITECTALIFELEKSRQVDFSNTKFYNNHLAISVLGGFTNATKEVIFTNCEFSDNEPTVPGNPAFNFRDNDRDFHEKIVFRNCTFKNNKGYKWYGDKIKLDQCKIDSTDFIDLH